MYVLEATYYNKDSLEPKIKTYRTVFDKRASLESHIKAKQSYTAHVYSFKVWLVNQDEVYKPEFVMTLRLNKVQP